MIPDTGGMAVLYEMCGHGVVSDMVLTGRADAPRRRSRTASCRASSRPTSSTTTAREMAEQIAAAPAVTVKLARQVIRHLSGPPIRASMDDELIYQTFLNRATTSPSSGPPGPRAAQPNYTGS